MLHHHGASLSNFFSLGSYYQHLNTECCTHSTSQITPHTDLCCLPSNNIKLGTQKMSLMPVPAIQLEHIKLNNKGNMKPMLPSAICAYLHSCFL